MCSLTIYVQLHYLLSSTITTCRYNLYVQIQSLGADIISMLLHTLYVKLKSLCLATISMKTVQFQLFWLEEGFFLFERLWQKLFLQIYKKLSSFPRQGCRLIGCCEQQSIGRQTAWFHQRTLTVGTAGLQFNKIGLNCCSTAYK